MTAFSRGSFPAAKKRNNSRVSNATPSSSAGARRAPRRRLYWRGADTRSCCLKSIITRASNRRVAAADEHADRRTPRRARDGARDRRAQARRGFPGDNDAATTFRFCRALGKTPAVRVPGEARGIRRDAVPPRRAQRRACARGRAGRASMRAAGRHCAGVKRETGEVAAYQARYLVDASGRDAFSANALKLKRKHSQHRVRRSSRTSAGAARGPARTPATSASTVSSTAGSG